MLRILTYNVHRCLGTDRRLSPHRIAEVIGRYKPDIVALQELDIGRARTGGVDQAHLIARQLDMDLHFHAARRVGDELYGDAILTSRPSRLVKAGPLPALAVARRLEPRGALWVAVEVGGGVEVQVVNTHLSLIGRERVRQVATLLGPDWLGHLDCNEPRILLGDFNAVPRSAAYKAITRTLGDAQLLLGRSRPKPTFPARLPTLRLDHVFVSPASVRVTGIEVPRHALARSASDHLPLVADLDVSIPRPRHRAMAAAQGGLDAPDTQTR